MDTALADLVEAPGDSLLAQFRDDVIAGLSRAPKAIPARWFYDRRGSELFERITQLPEYYPTRTEIGILTEHCREIGGAIGGGRTVVEFGAGSATKTPLLLRCIDPAAYVAVDISGDFLADSCAALAADFPSLPIFPVEGDFTRPAHIPLEARRHQRLGFFPGSTIGNFEPEAAAALLRVMRATLGDNSLLLIGMDRVKEPVVLVDAYDDAEGVTAEFDLNLARRINRELGGDIPLEALRHRAIWNPAKARIEMHLEAQRAIRFQLRGQHFAMQAGETIHTENSHKYDDASADALLRAGAWEPARRWLDAESQFMVILARAA
jgi:dimethylhistidine N-methyltransferase